MMVPTEAPVSSIPRLEEGLQALDEGLNLKRDSSQEAGRRLQFSARVFTRLLEGSPSLQVKRVCHRMLATAYAALENWEKAAEHDMDAAAADANLTLAYRFVVEPPLPRHLLDDLPYPGSEIHRDWSPDMFDGVDELCVTLDELCATVG